MNKLYLATNKSEHGLHRSHLSFSAGAILHTLRLYLEYFLRGFLLILRLLLKTFSDSGLDGDEEAWEDNFLLFSPGTPDLGLLGIGIDIYRYI